MGIDTGDCAGDYTNYVTFGTGTAFTSWWWTPACADILIKCVPIYTQRGVTPPRHVVPHHERSLINTRSRRRGIVKL